VLTLEDHPAAVAARVDDDEPDVVDVAGQVLGELDAVLAPWFARAGTRLAGQQYVRGLASTVERKNSWHKPSSLSLSRSVDLVCVTSC